MAQITISSEDAAQIREYLTRAEAHAKNEPPMFKDEEHDQAPTEEWEAWNSAGEEITDTYRDVIVRTLFQYLSDHKDVSGGIPGNMPVGDILRSYVEADPEEVALAQIQVSKSFTNHAFIMQSLNQGIYDIAMGKPYYQLAPKRGGSREVWKLTASADSCTRFLGMGGNGEIVKDVVDTVYSLIKDPKADKFIYRGRVWITVNTILQEMLRTQGGTSRGRNKTTTHEMVDAALLLASGAQIVGTDPSGNPTDTMYLLDGVRREAVTFNKHEYKSVWGFSPEVNMTGDYADGKYSYSYPLLAQEEPLTIDQAWINHYLKDALNEARGHLYTKNGKPARTKKWTITKSWPEIFKKARPLQDMPSRKKLALVGDFEKVLTVLADMDAHDELREGRPMYIRAYSVRDGQRGRGKGAWVSLVIECTTKFHTPQVDLTGSDQK